MANQLAALLAASGAVSVEGMERARAHQLRHGGSLDTALLELGLIAPEGLTALLARAAELPPAPDERLQPDVHARQAVPARVAEHHRLAPFRVEGDALHALAGLPVDTGALDELSFMLSLRIVPYAAPEWRVKELQARLAGEPLAPRYAALAQRSRPPGIEPAGPEAAGSTVAGGGWPGLTSGAQAAAAPSSAVPPAAPANEPPEGPNPERLAFDEVEIDITEDADPAGLTLDDLAALPPVQTLLPPVQPWPEAGAGLWPRAEASQAIADAVNRDEVVEAALRFGRNTFPAVALLAVGHGEVTGQQATGWEGARERVRSVRLDPRAATLFRAPLETRAPCLGPPAREPGNAALLDAMGRPWPGTVLVFPVVVRDRVVALLYGDAAEPQPASEVGWQAREGEVNPTEVILLWNEVGPAFDRILRARKRLRAFAPPLGATSSPAAPGPRVGWAILSGAPPVDPERPGPGWETQEPARDERRTAQPPQEQGADDCWTTRWR